MSWPDTPGRPAGAPHAQVHLERVQAVGRCLGNYSNLVGVAFAGLVQRVEKVKKRSLEGKKMKRYVQQFKAEPGGESVQKVQDEFGVVFRVGGVYDRYKVNQTERKIRLGFAGERTIGFVGERTIGCVDRLINLEVIDRVFAPVV